MAAVCGLLSSEVDAVVVTFAPRSELGAYRRHLGLDARGVAVVTDPDRSLYRSFGFRRGTWRAVYGVGTLRMYGRLLRSGRRLRRPTQDTRQLGGDVVIDPSGVVRAVFRPASPDARPSLAQLAAVIDRDSAR